MEKWVVVLLLLAAMELAPAEVTKRYVGVGGELRVEPPKISGPITGVLWNHNVNLLAEWIKDSLNLTYYGEFKGRTTLNTTTGALWVRNMSVEDAGLYSVDINNKLQDLRYDVKVIQEVPKPEVWVRQPCTKDQTKCTLSCDGDTAGSEPVSYYWRTDDGPWEKSERYLVINKTETEKVKTFSCRMENPVSHRDSKSEGNPLFVDYVLIGGVVGGVTVGVIIIIIIIVVIFVPRRRARQYLKDMNWHELDLMSEQQFEMLRKHESSCGDEKQHQGKQERLRRMERLNRLWCLDWPKLERMKRQEQLRRLERLRKWGQLNEEEAQHLMGQVRLDLQERQHLVELELMCLKPPMNSVL